MAEQFTGIPGKYVKIADTIKSFGEILEGKVDDVPEQAFLNVGGVDDAREKGEQLKAAG